jgi:hypothetical protein
MRFRKLSDFSPKVYTNENKYVIGGLMYGARFGIPTAIARLE